MIHKGRGASRKLAAGLRNSDADRNRRCRGRVRPLLFSLETRGQELAPQLTLVEQPA
jgi:hypothetical protein